MAPALAASPDHRLLGDEALHKAIGMRLFKDIGERRVLTSASKTTSDGLMSPARLSESPNALRVANRLVRREAQRRLLSTNPALRPAFVAARSCGFWQSSDVLGSSGPSSASASGMSVVHRFAVPVGPGRRINDTPAPFCVLAGIASGLCPPPWLACAIARTQAGRSCPSMTSVSSRRPRTAQRSDRDPS